MKSQHFMVGTYEPNSHLVLKSTNGLLTPTFSLKVSEVGSNQTKVTFLLYFDKKSALFQVSNFYETEFSKPNLIPNF
jgi:hypothetical protein